MATTPISQKSPEPGPVSNPPPSLDNSTKGGRKLRTLPVTDRSPVSAKFISRFVLIVCVVAVLVLLGYCGYSYFSEPWSEPHDIRVTNVTERAITISWVTDEPTKGYVIFSTEDDFLPGPLARYNKDMIVDERDMKRAELQASLQTEENLDLIEGGDVNYADVMEEAVLDEIGEYYVHHVTIGYLDPETTYYFMVGNGYRFVKQTEGDVFSASSDSSITTFAELEEMTVPDPSYGKVVSSDYEVVDDGMIFMHIEGLMSMPLSAALSEDGSWYIDLSDFRTPEGERLAGWDEYSENELLFVEAGKYGQSEEVVNPMYLDAPADPIVVSTGAVEETADDTEEGAAEEGGGDEESKLVSSVLAETDPCVDPELPDEEYVGCRCFVDPGECILAPGSASGDACSSPSGDGVIKIGLCPGSANIRCCYTGTAEQESPTSGTCGEIRCGPNYYDCWTSGPNGGRGLTTTDGKECIWKACTPDGTWLSSDDCCGPGCDLASAMEPQECGKVCNHETCACLKYSGGEPTDTFCSSEDPSVSRGETCPGYGSDGTRPIVSCNSPCTDPDGCVCRVGGTRGGDPCDENSARHHGWAEKEQNCGPAPTTPPSTSPSGTCPATDKYFDDRTKCSSATLCGDTGTTCLEIGTTLYGTCYICPQDPPPGKYSASPLESDSGNCADDFGGVGTTCPVRCKGIVIQNHLCTDRGSGTIPRWKVIIAQDQSCGEATDCICRDGMRVIKKDHKCVENREDIDGRKLISQGTVCCSVGNCVCFWSGNDTIINDEWCPSTGLCNGPDDVGKVCNRDGETCVKNGRTYSCDGPVPDPEVCGMNPQVISQSQSSLVSQVHAQDTDGNTLRLSPSSGLYSFENSGVYCMPYKEDTYCFEIRAPGEMRLYIDVNASGAYEEDEDVNIADDVVEISLSREAEIDTWEIYEGFNLVSFDIVDTTQTGMASEFLTVLNNEYNDSFYSIADFASGRWIVMSNRDGVEYGGNDFQIVPGRGYLIRSKAHLFIDITGKRVQDAVPVTLREGWNLVAVHGSDEELTAVSLIDSIDALDLLDADNVTRWNATTSRYEGLQKENDEVYGFDFPIEDKLGYFVRIAEGTGTWTPGEADRVLY